MKLSISNIAWCADYDADVYALMQKHAYTGLEIAPTRILPQNPYDRPELIRDFRAWLYQTYHFEISSMQSIWYGKNENIFRSASDRLELEAYTRKAILFAEQAKCKNLVFGCPKNRNNENDIPVTVAEDFLRNMARFAFEHNTCFSIEPNPSIYHTNYITTTEEAFQLVRAIHQKGLMVNVDFGTILSNQESLDILDFSCIGHIHISEPFLKPLEKRSVHRELFRMAAYYHYDNYISIEMGQINDLSELEEIMEYISSVWKSENVSH